jgi:hypothetical protein
LTKESTGIKDVISVEGDDVVLYRVFNFNPKGYIIVTADDNAEPLIGYGLDSNFSFDDAPPSLLYLLGEYKQEMKYIIKNGLKADIGISSKWERLSSDDYASLKSYTIGTYLLGTAWNQSSPYNNSCPLDPNTGSRCLVGCTAVAMGMILDFWNCRVFPDGTRTYYPNIYFTNPLTVNFYNQSYNWSDIGNNVNATAEFLYHCGVAIRVNYTDSATSGYSQNVESAMKNNFGFQTSGYKSKNSYSASTWTNMLKADIDAGRPIYYDGENTTVTPNTAHAWVIDGYKPTNEFHCNWGWGGLYNDTWYYLTDLTPGSHNYNSNQHAILGAQPILDACSGLFGADFICATESYSVSIPSTASVLWSKSSNLSQVGVNTNPTYTVSKATTGSGSVTATIKNSQGQTFLTRTKTVWVGNPGTPITTPSGYPTLEIGLGAFQPISLFKTPVFTGGTINWWSIGSIEPVNSTNSPTCTFEAVTLGTGNFYVTVQNTCGTSSLGGGTVNVVSGGGGQLMLVLAPNPATDETMISIVTTEVQIVEEIAEWDFEVFDNAQNLKAAKTKLKGNSTQLQTAGWKEGVYAVRVNYKPEGKPEEVLTGKLVVTR